jgi:hypothetical protein
MDAAKTAAATTAIEIAPAPIPRLIAVRPYSSRLVLPRALKVSPMAVQNSARAFRVKFRFGSFSPLASRPEADAASRRAHQPAAHSKQRQPYDETHAAELEGGIVGPKGN